jgi:hypothetical protein
MKSEMAKRITALVFIIGMLLLVSTGFCEELPRPNYDNSVIFSVTYSLGQSSSEIDYIKSRFGNGIYAPLYFTQFAQIDMDWTVDPSQADSGIQAFKNQVEALITKAKTYNVELHFIINYGLARNVGAYSVAKEEDIRNAQWYNDNNLAAADQLSGVMNDKVFGTF